MRYFGLGSWLRVVSQVTNIDEVTLTTRHVDLDRAIIALRAGGGPSLHEDLLEDVAAACHRLLLNLLLLRPYAGDGADRAALAAITGYARNRGCVLDLGGASMQFVVEVDAHTFGRGGLGPEEAIRALRCSLRQVREVGRPKFSLAGYNMAVSAAVSNPSRNLAKASEDLVMRVEAFAQRHGAVVSKPFPQHRTSSRYGKIQLPQLRRNDSNTTTSTAEIFTRSIDRITDSQVHVIVMDPRSTGSAVEREWSLRTRKPIYELQFADGVHPHSDAPPFVTPIRVDPRSTADAAHALFDHLRTRSWELADSLAASQAEALKNGDTLKQLQLRWSELDDRQRDTVAAALKMSRPYIEGLLSNPSALELASQAQRIGLTTTFNVQDRHQVAAPTALSDSELQLLTKAATDEGLAGFKLVKTVQLAGAEWRRAYAYARLTELHEARESIARARALHDRLMQDDDWD